MEWVPMPPFGLILSKNVPTGVRMPMECLKHKKTKFFRLITPLLVQKDYRPSAPHHVKSKLGATPFLHYRPRRWAKFFWSQNLPSTYSDFGNSLFYIFNKTL